jgi:hypothetical protein
MNSGNMELSRALRISGILLILGLAVEVVSMLWQKPLAFLLFAGVGAVLIFAGILFYLYSLVSSSSTPHHNA